MKKPIWRHDSFGFSGGWYPDDSFRELSVLGQYGWGYSVTVVAPILGDASLTIYLTPVRLSWRRRSLKALRKAEENVRARNERR